MGGKAQGAGLQGLPFNPAPAPLHPDPPLAFPLPRRSNRTLTPTYTLPALPPGPALHAWTNARGVRAPVGVGGRQWAARAPHPPAGLASGVNDEAYGILPTAPSQALRSPLPRWPRRWPHRAGRPRSHTGSPMLSGPRRRCGARVGAGRRPCPMQGGGGGEEGGVVGEGSTSSTGRVSRARRRGLGWCLRAWPHKRARPPSIPPTPLPPHECMRTHARSHARTHPH